jgi:hypothetical protein
MSRLAFFIGLLVTSGIALAQSTVDQSTTEPHDLYYYNSLKQPEPTWNFDTSISSGISYLVFNHARNDAFYGRTGAYIDTNINFHLADLHLPVVLGAGVTASSFWDNDNFLGVDTVYSNVNLIAAEGRISIPFNIFEGEDQGPYITPRIGIGGLYDNYVFQTPFNGNKYSNGGGFEVRPGILFGYRYQSFSVGVEFSYMLAWGNFGDFSSGAQEVRGGFLMSYRF